MGKKDRLEIVGIELVGRAGVSVGVALGEVGVSSCAEWKMIVTG